MDGGLTQSQTDEVWRSWSASLAMAEDTSLGEDYITPSSASPTSPIMKTSNSLGPVSTHSTEPNACNTTSSSIIQDSSKSEDEGILIVCHNHDDGCCAPLARPDTFSDDVLEPAPDVVNKSVKELANHTSANYCNPGVDLEVDERESLLPSTSQSPSRGYSDGSLGSDGYLRTVKHDQDVTATDCDMLEFAENNYNVHVTSSGYGAVMLKTLGMTRRRSTSEIVPVQDLIKYSKSTCMPTSLMNLHHPENVDIACSIFRDLCRYMRGELKKEQCVPVIRQIIQHGIQRVELRDEIFCQLVRQTNCNPIKQNSIRAWQLMLLCCISFQPSHSYRKYLIGYIRKCQDGTVSSITKLAGQCWKYLNKARHQFSRKAPPSQVEIEAVQQCVPVICRFHFLDGTMRSVNVGFLDTADDVVRNVARRVGIKDNNGWAVYESTPERDRHIRSSEYLLDVMSDWEEKCDRPHPMRNHLIHYKRRNRQALSATDSPGKRSSPVMPVPNYGRFIFSKRLMKPLDDSILQNDPIALHFMYAQAVHHVVQVDDYAVQESLAIHLAGLQAQVLHGDYVEHKNTRYEPEEDYLCDRVLASGSEDWRDVIAYAHRTYASGNSKSDCQLKYLALANQCLLFGCSKFYAHYKGNWEFGEEIVIAVNYVGVKLISVKEKTLACEFLYDEIETLWFDNSMDILMYILKDHAQCSQKCFMFDCRDCAELVSLSKQYSSIIEDHIWEESKYKTVDSQMKAAESDCIKVYANILQCRQALVRNGHLHKPEQQGSGVIRTALKRLSGKSTEDVTQTESDFKCSHWKFSRLPFKHSLMKQESRELADVAMRMFNSTLVFTGLESSALLNAQDLGVVAQTLVRKCLDSDRLCNEFYLQLIKQTTAPPPDVGKVVLHYWQLLSMCVWCMLPTDGTILQLLTSHIQWHVLQKFTEDGKYAKYCLQGLQRTKENKSRNFPPSNHEMECLIRRQRLTEYVQLLDGHSILIEFDSQSTVKEVLDLVKATIGMKMSAQGFAIYNITPSSEGAVENHEKLADILYQWERYTKPDTPRDCKLIFKKRLFVDPIFNPSDPLEVEVLYHQSVTDVFEGKVPLTKEDAIHLCALTAQADFGDHADVPHVDYTSVMRVLPRLLRNFIYIEEIERVHRTLCGISSFRADVAFLDVLKNWPLYGATFFEVAQSYTEALPAKMWLAISQIGLSLMEVKGQVIFCTVALDCLLQCVPASKQLTITARTKSGKNKMLLDTTEANQIVRLIHDYQAALGILWPNDEHKKQSSSTTENGDI